VGFHQKTFLIFDEICRRDETRDVLWFYNEDLYCPHRDSVCKLRENMSAVVLWGTFKDVRLWLELDGQSLKRLIIHAYHTQSFCRIGQGKLRKTSREFREKYGKSQDLALMMAAQFVGLQDRIKPQILRD
jgi:hypothetical protein